MADKHRSSTQPNPKSKSKTQTQKKERSASGNQAEWPPLEPTAPAARASSSAAEAATTLTTSPQRGIPIVQPPKTQRKRKDAKKAAKQASLSPSGSSGAGTDSVTPPLHGSLPDIDIIGATVDVYTTPSPTGEITATATSTTTSADSVAVSDTAATSKPGETAAVAQTAATTAVPPSSTATADSVATSSITATSKSGKGHTSTVVPTTAVLDTKSTSTSEKRDDTARATKSSKKQQQQQPTAQKPPVATTKSTTSTESATAPAAKVKGRRRSASTHSTAATSSTAALETAVEPMDVDTAAVTQKGATKQKRPKKEMLKVKIGPKKRPNSSDKANGSAKRSKSKTAATPHSSTEDLSAGDSAVSAIPRSTDDKPGQSGTNPHDNDGDDSDESLYTVNSSPPFQQGHPPTNTAATKQLVTPTPPAVTTAPPTGTDTAGAQPSSVSSTTLQTVTTTTSPPVVTTINTQSTPTTVTATAMDITTPTTVPTTPAVSTVVVTTAAQLAATAVASTISHGNLTGAASTDVFPATNSLINKYMAEDRGTSLADEDLSMFLNSQATPQSSCPQSDAAATLSQTSTSPIQSAQQPTHQQHDGSSDEGTVGLTDDEVDPDQQLQPQHDSNADSGAELQGEEATTSDSHDSASDEGLGPEFENVDYENCTAGQLAAVLLKIQAKKEACNQRMYMTISKEKRDQFDAVREKYYHDMEAANLTPHPTPEDAQFPGAEVADPQLPRVTAEVRNLSSARRKPPLARNNRYTHYLLPENDQVDGNRLTSPWAHSTPGYETRPENQRRSDWRQGYPYPSLLPIREGARAQIYEDWELVCFPSMTMHRVIEDLRSEEHPSRRIDLMLLLAIILNGTAVGKAKALYFIKTLPELVIAAHIIQASKTNHLECYIQPFRIPAEHHTRAVSEDYKQVDITVPPFVDQFVTGSMLLNNTEHQDIMRLLCIRIHEGVVLAIEVETLVGGFDGPLADILYGELYIKTWWDLRGSQSMWLRFFKGHSDKPPPFPTKNCHSMTRACHLRFIREVATIDIVANRYWKADFAAVVIDPHALYGPIGQFYDQRRNIVATNAQATTRLVNNIVTNLCHRFVLLGMSLRKLNRLFNPFKPEDYECFDVISLQFLDGQPILQTINPDVTMTAIVLENILAEAAQTHSNRAWNVTPEIGGNIHSDY